MPRINFDDDVEANEEFWRLIPLVGGDRDRALGKLVRFFRLVQAPYAHGKSVSKEMIDAAGLSEMVDSGWAVPMGDGYTAKGASEQFAWLVQKISAGKLGGRPTGTGRKPGVTGRLAAVTERQPEGTGTNPPALALAPALALKQKQKKETTATSPAAAPLAEVWNENCGNLPKVRLPLVGPRAKQAADRLKERPDMAGWAEAAKKCAESDFCRGDNDRKWIANFTFFIRPESFDKIMEGMYDRRDKPVRKPDSDFKLPPRLARLFARHQHAEQGGEGGAGEAGPARVPHGGPSPHPQAGVGPDAGAGRGDQADLARGPEGDPPVEDQGDPEWIP